ncbi:putative poxvirus A32, P-loop containing nucleoside triphosphate hydrolase [Plasmopara halstedii]
MQNFYESIPKSKLKKFPKNDHFELPFRMCVASPSGSGKSNTVLFIIALLSKCFTKIVICTKTNETLYDHLQDTIDNVQVIEEGMVPAMSEYDSETSKLIIFDDLVIEPKRTQAQISQYFIRGRKQGWSMIYISQSYFGIPKTIRINSQYVILGRNLTQRDLGIICRDFPTDIPIKTFIDLYKRTTSEKMTTMLMDITDRKIYRNVIEFIRDL